MAIPPERPSPPDDALAWLDAYCDGRTVRIEEAIRPDADLQRIRSAQERSSRHALSGIYSLGGVQRPLDLNAQWYVLRLQVDEGSDYAGLGGGPLNASAEYLRSLRSLLEAALRYVST